MWIMALIGKTKYFLKNKYDYSMHSVVYRTIRKVLTDFAVFDG